MATLWGRLKGLFNRGGTQTKRAGLVDPFRFFASSSVWTAVQSSNLEAVAYLAGPNDYSQGGIMAVRFRNNRVYWYLFTQRSVFDGLLAATSKGQYLDRVVKKGGYYYELKA